MITTTTALAADLRKFADLLDSASEKEILRPSLLFSHYGKDQKESFYTVARRMPRPMGKSLHYGESEIHLTYESGALLITSTIPRDATCEMIEPARKAVYKCEPILSVEEDAALEQVESDF